MTDTSNMERINTTNNREEEEEGKLSIDKILNGTDLDYDHIIENASIRQSVLNIGLIGHVAHGKSTLAKAICGYSTARFSEDRSTRRTIHLGYANAKIFSCLKCPAPQRFFTGRSTKLTHPCCPICTSPSKLARHISLLDCPGHDIYL